MAAYQRLSHELKEMRQDERGDSQNQVYSVAPIGDNLLHWEGFLFGPPGTPYEGGVFTIRMDFPTSYPHKPPVVKLLTKIFHPNINTSGSPCIDILKDKWSCVLTISKILMSLCSLLAEPNPDDPLNSEAGSLMKRDRKEFERQAALWTQSYAQFT